ncbi:MAG: MaoC family dehydratase, partial [Dehalococcoidia bacterium]
TTAVWRYCEVVEDGNPVYWDEEFAKGTRFGRLIAPPQGLFSFSFAPWWTPDYLTQRISEEAGRLNPPDVGSGGEVMRLVNQHGYTVATVRSQEAEYIAPFGPGDGRLKMRSKTIDVSPEKQTRPGKGVFITSVTEYYTERDDRLVARSQMVLLMYNPSSPREASV